MIDCDLPTLNDYIQLERGNKYVAATLKKRTTLSVCWIAKNKDFILPVNTCFDIEINWYRKNNKHDSDNVFFGIKFVLDGIVKAGKLRGDGRKHINNISNKIHTDKAINLNYCTIEFVEIKK